MKKFFISAAIIAMAFAASAQRTEGGDNLVKNGSFDAEGYEQAVHSEFNWEPMSSCRDLSVLPDWTFSTGGMWNGGIEVMDDPIADLGDGDTRPEEDYHWLRMYTDTDNMWTSIQATTKVTGLEVGKTYKLDLVVCGMPGVEVTSESDGSKFTQTLTVTVKIAEPDQVTPENLGKEIKSEDLTDIQLDWERRTLEFKASAAEMYVQISMGNWMPNTKHDQAWVGFDCLDLYDPNGTPAGVADVVVEENAPVEYFNLQGIRVANPENGVFIRRQGDKAVKVAL